ncbi:cubilin-like [Pomacea canaliculata]|uniref:cubilin-like n=1 Tax=Pomacea canaliculata TaxID=400727 RepID=UPI000D74002E|nr:cubilin-like [Pomacea canaliculata]
MMMGSFCCDYKRINQHFKMYKGTTKDQSSLIAIKSKYNKIAVDEAPSTVLMEYIANYTSNFSLSITMLATQNSTCGSAINASAGEGDIDVQRSTTHYLNKFHRNGICAWTIEAEEDEVIQLLITELDMRTVVPEAGYSDSSYLEIYDGVQTDSSLLVRARSDDELLPVTSRTRLLLIVLTLNEDFGFADAYFAARYKSFNKSAILRDCGGDISGDEGVVLSPNYPANYDNLRVCEWRITVEDPFFVRMEIHDIDIGPLFAPYPCAGDSLLFTGAYPSGDSGSNFRLCGMRINDYGLVIYSVNNSMTMRFVSDWEDNGRGFNASWRKACQWPQQTTEGWIQSPGFPSSYPDNVNCLYEIQIPYYQAGYFITFTFDSFNLQEPDSKGSCIYDYLEILQVPWNNPGYVIPPEAKKVCGREPRQSLTTYFPTTLHFVTDSNITKGGFNISFVRTMAGCGENLLVGDKGFVTSPNYPGTFPPGLRCETTIRVEPGHNITLTFESFSLGYENNNCLWSMRGILEVYDKNSSGSILIGTYCGYSSPQPITSTSNEVTLVFTSSYNYFDTGFNATYVSTSALTGKYLSFLMYEVFSAVIFQVVDVLEVQFYEIV